MARAVSRIITGSEQDVLAGTVAGIAPSDAPYYDVEVKCSQSADVSTARMTLLAGGAAVLENAWIPRNKLLAAGINEEPRSDAPNAYFKVPAGTRITLNINQGATATTSVYVELRESTASAPLGIGKIDAIDATSVINMQDVLSGSPIGTLPLTANAWELSLEAAILVEGTSNAVTQDANVTLQVGSDVIAENFILPAHSLQEWPIEERDTLISTLAQGGDRLTLNVFKPSAQTVGSGEVAYLAYSIFANPVA